MSLKALIIKHVDFEGPAAAGLILNDLGFFTAEVLAENFDFNLSPLNFKIIVLMGGPMSVNDTEIYPWLNKEQVFVKKAIESGVKILGFCLGAQMIAKSIGGNVYPGKYKEIGWFPVWGLLPGNVSVELFHWHGETFDLPSEAQVIANSEACEKQVFLYKENVLAFQCHPEATPDSVLKLYSNCADEIVPGGPFIQTESQILLKRDFSEMHNLLRTMIIDFIDN